MTNRRWILVGVFAALVLTYIIVFTEWLRPGPIEIASQVRVSVQPPRFGWRVTVPLEPRPPAQLLKSGQPVQPAKSGQPPNPVKPPPADQIERIQRPEKGGIDQAPGGVANVTFSLDAIYVLTALRVEDVPSDGSAPQVLWNLAGKSRPTRSLLYGRNPEGMKPVVPGATSEVLNAGVPYRLFLAAGRRRGTNDFKTMPAPALSGR